MDVLVLLKIRHAHIHAYIFTYDTLTVHIYIFSHNALTVHICIFAHNTLTVHIYIFTHNALTVHIYIFTHNALTVHIPGQVDLPVLANMMTCTHRLHSLLLVRHGTTGLSPQVYVTFVRNVYVDAMYVCVCMYVCPPWNTGLPTQLYVTFVRNVYVEAMYVCVRACVCVCVYVYTMEPQAFDVRYIQHLCACIC